MSSSSSTREFLNSLVKGVSFEKVQRLDFSEGLIKERPDLLEHLGSFTCLESLDVSKNDLDDLPSVARLETLKHLDVSDNDLQSMDFLKSFPFLTSLKICGNARLDEESRFLACFFAKKLATIDDESTETFKSGLKKLRKMLFQIVTEVHGLYAREVETRVHESLPHGFPSDLVEELLRLVKRRAADPKDPPEFPTLQDRISRELIKKYLDEISRLPPSEPEVFVSSEGKSIQLGMKMLAPVPDYDPVFFVRCHSANDQKSDKETKIWRAAFRPGSYDLATCGGNYVCLIDCEAGKVVLKYKLLEEDFYTVVWTHLRIAGTSRRTWMIVTAGFRGSIRLLRPDRMTCSVEVKHHKGHINCLLVHPSNQHRIFSGSEDKTILLWHVDDVIFPSHRTNFSLLLKFVVPANQDAGSDVLNLLIRGAYLVAATENDLVFWQCDDVAGERFVSAASRKGKVAIQRKRDFMAELPYMLTDFSVVDGMVLLGSTPYVASKYYKDGIISVWDMDETILRHKENPQAEENVDCALVTRLKWSDTEELYINISSSDDGKLLLAGDDTGSIWIYNMERLKFFGGSEEPKMKVGEEEDILQPSVILEWPDVYAEDTSDSGLDLDFDKKKIIINYLTISEDNKFLVGCTDVNIVCVWKVTSTERNDDDGGGDKAEAD